MGDMAAVAAMPPVEMHNGDKVVHPFFSKPTDVPTQADVPASTPMAVQPNTESSTVPDSFFQTPPTSTDKKQKRRGKSEAAGAPHIEAEQIEVDPNHGRRKRKKTTPTKAPTQKGNGVMIASQPTRTIESQVLTTRRPLDDNTVSSSGAVNQNLPTQASSESLSIAADRPCSAPTNLSQGTNGAISQSSNAAQASTSEQPKKMMWWNMKTGTIGSPPQPSKKPAAPTEVASKPKRGRKKSKSRNVIILYGEDDFEARLRIADTIGQLLRGEHRVPVPTKALEAQQPTKPVEPTKPLATVPAQKAVTKTTVAHPFFLGKAAVEEAERQKKFEAKEAARANAPKVSAFAALMAKPASATPIHKQDIKPAANVNANGFPAFGSSNKLMKFPGSKEPNWPPADMMHVRGLPADSAKEHQPSPHHIPPKDHSKSKYSAPIATAAEDVLINIASDLEIESVSEALANIDTNQYPIPDEAIRLPQKHLISGRKVQKQVKPNLKCTAGTSTPTDDSEDELAGNADGSRSAHQALTKLFEDLPSALSAYDKSDYPMQSWTHKYAPTNASEVLQTGREAYLLKEWLQRLTVLSVDTGAPSSSQQSTSSKPEKKRKRAPKKLDGFVVSDGEEPDYLEEVDDIMENPTPTGSQSGPKTLIRRSAASQNSKELAKLLNAVVISGPNGCGKTAAVYAVAKELNYQVFEINSSSRRSGKDILEKVGDMTRNHLVHHAKEEVTVDEDEQRAAASLQADLQSGRQGTMNSFFKTTAPKSKLSTQKKSKPTDNKPMNDGTLLKKATQQKHQKQSLILFEEVDVLFEEDKQFWATTLSLIVQSKRPIIMTCNDENLVVNQALPLHAILRFSPPPLDIAVDYMLLVAAHEGHILKRPAVSALYQAQRYDLRASMTELEFWCQIGVGDRRGGFDWHLNRWPRGIDQDEDGNTIRVISQDTYRTGMGWLGRDSLCSSTGKWHNNVEDEVLREAWVGCGIDAGDWYETLGLSKWAVDNKIRALDPQERLQALEAYDDFTEAMSASDLIAAGSFGYGNSTLLDTTMPAISDKVREDTTLGYSFLQADMLERHHTLARDLSISVRTLSRADTDARSVALSSGSSQKSILPPLSEKQFIRYTTSSRTRPPQGITRHDFGVALDPIAIPQGNQEVGKYLDPSVIDRTTAIIAEDVAPYVRSIVAYDNKLAKERARLSNLLSEGGRTKRMRTTRSAFSALEGGQRGRVRRERWFGDEVNSVAVEKTAGRGWDNAREAVVEERRLVAIKALQEKQELREREEDAKGKVEAEARTGDVGEQGVDDDEDVEMEHT